MIKKYKKIIASILMVLSLMTILPATNAFAVSVSKEENAKYIQFIENDCKPTNDTSIYYNQNTGKYYGTTTTNELGLTMTKNTGFGTGFSNGYYGKDDGSLAQNEWIHRTELDGGTHWEHYSPDRKIQTGMQTIDGKVYNLGEKGSLKEGWWRDSNDHYSWHYSYPDGSVKEGWLNYGESWYYIYSDGKMAKDTTINGYSVNSKGIWS